MPKIDRRVQRTTQLLRDALIELIMERGYQSVTIQDITDRANLGRATFYLHFRDKDELLLSTLQEIVDELLARVDPQLDTMFTQGDISALRIIYQHAAENRDFYQIILRRRGASIVEHQLSEYIATKANKYIQEVLQGQSSPIPLDLACNIFSRALLGAIEWWLDHDMPYSPEYMAQAFYEVTVVGTLNALGIKHG